MLKCNESADTAGRLRMDPVGIRGRLLSPGRLPSRIFWSEFGRGADPSGWSCFQERRIAGIRPGLDDAINDQ